MNGITFWGLLALPCCVLALIFYQKARVVGLLYEYSDLTRLILAERPTRASVVRLRQKHLERVGYSATSQELGDCSWEHWTDSCIYWATGFEKPMQIPPTCTFRPYGRREFSQESLGVSIGNFLVSLSDRDRAQIRRIVVIRDDRLGIFGLNTMRVIQLPKFAELQKMLEKGRFEPSPAVTSAVA